MVENRRKPGTRALSAAERAACVRMARGGAPQMEIARELGCSQATVARVLGAADRKKPVPRRRRTDRRARRPEPARSEEREVVTGELEADFAGALEAGDEAWLEKTLRRVDEAVNAALKSANHQATVALAKLAVDLRQRRQALRPPEPPDPDLDPQNRAARDALLERVRAMVERAEQRSAAAA